MFGINKERWIVALVCLAISAYLWHYAGVLRIQETLMLREFDLTGSNEALAMGFLDSVLELASKVGAIIFGGLAVVCLFAKQIGGFFFRLFEGIFE